MNQLVTVDELKSIAPRAMRGKITQDLVDRVSNLVKDEEFREIYRNNLLSFSRVLEESNRWTVEQYMDAVRYVSYKTMGDTNTKAYARTFSKKFMDWKANGVGDKTIARYITAYNGSKLVNAVWEQSSIPFHIMNMDYRQKALMVQVDLMCNARSEKVKSDAANSVLTHTAPPKESKIALEVTQKDSTELDDLKQAMRELAAQQVRNVSTGSHSAKDIAGSSLVIDHSTLEDE